MFYILIWFQNFIFYYINVIIYLSNVKILILIFNLLFTIYFYGQNTIGLPSLHNYTKLDYNGGLQNWDIKQDKNGIIYIANNEGLLSFDGVYWKINPLPNKTIVRSIFINTDNKIYVGGQNELGYFYPNTNGILQYYSLLNIIPATDRNFDDVWDIEKCNNELFVRSNSKIFKISGNTATVFKAYKSWLYLGVCNNTLYAQDELIGLLEFKNNVFTKIAITKESILPEKPISNIFISNKNNLLITTIKNGIFELDSISCKPILNSNNAIFKEQRIYCASQIDNETIALGTNKNGVQIIDFKGNVKQYFSKLEGLQNKNVLSVFVDKQKNLWLGLDNGIDFITYNSAIKLIDPSLQIASAYTAIVKQNQLYIGTSTGLYSSAINDNEDFSFCKNNFTLLPNSDGQVWNISDVNNKLLMGHHEGAFEVKNNNAILINKNQGFWNFLPSYNNGKIIAGTYNGLAIFDETGNISKVPNFLESSRYLVIDDDGAIWVSHPTLGIYKLTINDQKNYVVTNFSQANGLPSNLENHIFKLKNEVVAATLQGIYLYNKKLNRFENSSFYKNIFKNISLRYLKYDYNNNLWFISEKQIGVVNTADKNPILKYFPELTNKLLSGFEFIYPFNEKNVFISGAKGLYNINYTKYKSTPNDLSILIRNVTITSKTDSVIYGGNSLIMQTNKLQKPSISSKWKLISFQFASPNFSNQTNLEYSYKLKNFDKNWSAWSRKTEKDYTNLPAGNYTFEVKVRNNLGNESAIASYSFKILPPWYLSFWAYIFYFFVFAFLLFRIIKWQKNRFVVQQKKYEDEQQKLLYIIELERARKESEIVALQNEKLEADINYQNTELANTALHLVKKGEIIAKIKSELSHLGKEIENPKSVAEIKKIAKALNEDENMDKEWEHFAIHFDKVHSNFLNALKKQHPTITPTELKLSAYLRMNLSTKEIAQLMNISVRGVEIGRYRLRKKLVLPTETNLFNYLITIG